MGPLFLEKGGDSLALSYNEFKGNGSIKQFTFSFPYIEKQEVFCAVDNSLVSFTWVNASTILLGVAPKKDAAVHVYRSTHKVNPIVRFQNGAGFREEDLHLLTKQLLHLAQEANENIAVREAVSFCEIATDLIQKAQADVQQNTNKVVGINNFLENAASGVPIGSILVFVKGAQLPGYLLADGSKYDTAYYYDLNKTLKADTLPDLSKTGLLPVGLAYYIKALHEPNVISDFKRLRITVQPIPPTQQSYAVYDDKNYTATLYIRDGVTGPHGPAGPKGQDGEKGTNGLQGPRGLQGPQGTQGTKGATGNQGPQGATGLLGPVGPTGPQGARGEKGKQGDIGPEGPEGSQGVAGTIGPQGASGEKGERGPQGPRGERGPAGPPGGGQGSGVSSYGFSAGDFFFDDEGNLIFQVYGVADSITASFNDEGEVILTFNATE